MKALRSALEAGRAQGYKHTGFIKSKGRDGPFGHWLVKLFSSGDKGPTYSRRSVKTNLDNDYGASVGRKVMQNAGSKPLTARRIVSLHNRAAKLKQTIDKHNHQHSHSWMNLDKKGSMASRLFTRATGYSPQQLPDYERNRLQQHLEAAFYHNGDHELSRQEAGQLVDSVLTYHSTAFASAAPEVSRVLGYESGRFYPEDLDRWLDTQPMDAYDRNLAREFQYNSSQTAQLTSRSPLNLIHQKQWSDQIENTREHIHKLGQSLNAIQRGALSGLPEPVRQAMAYDVYHQINQGQQHISYLEGLEKADFRGQEQLRKAEEHMLNTGLLVLHESLEKAQTKGQFQKAQSLMNQIDDVKNRKAQLNGKHFTPVVHMKKAVKVDTEALKKELIEAGVSSRSMKKLWFKASAAVANSSEWKTIEKVIPVRADGQVHNYTSQLVPAGQMRFTPPGQAVGNRDPFISSYSGRGRSSADSTERIHAINLFDTEVTSSDGKTLYKGLRSGTLFSHKIKDKAKQTSTLENRAMEVLRAAFVQKFAALTAEQKQEIIDGAPLPFDMVATSLLSPDQIRHVTGIHDDELAFQKAQNDMMVKLCEEPVTMQVFDSNGHAHTVTADIRLTTLNIPVNKFGLNPALSRVGRTWEQADMYNQMGLDKLLGNSHPDSDIGGVVGEWLSGPGQNSPDYDKVQQLVYQVRTLYSQGLHHMEGNDAYDLVERVQLLAFKVGALSHIYCKSGKDRTGEADARTKQFAAEVDRLGYVPDPGAPLTQEHREAVQTFMYGSGNLEVQQQNIGVPHFKTALGKEEIGEDLFELIH
ncbi:inositol phosphate phosphatase SopB [Parendozoicomonas sp. Alg238-R29]|uniref:inositol phosphate phosphatase SopB n=1 Tax=Parendozoicomonas sp. Alg238-R29 TaxID=2993446 RepID=UPI00248EE732|nr:inositol phosphate phosphatase SopB [Parendozoicomonas sp. Alg238-R29]